MLGQGVKPGNTAASFCVQKTSLRLAGRRASY
ncbi:hypothetical protein FOLKNPGA_03740 (plasmid) [Legionella sp. PC1000]|nr:hypothetical protein FOLKNPGA_02852 [Legionella sp. PC1000]QLZ70920.1 hypothetical protein FOLKNPGA_03740 [Legionella sp. PC1000]